MRGRLAELASTRIRGLANAASLSPLAAMRLSALVALDIVALAFAIGAVVGEDDQAAAPRSDWRPPRLLAAGGERAAAGDDADALARPIFWRSRRPLPGSPIDRKKKAAQAQVTASGFSVAGIIKYGPRARVFVVAPSAPEGRWLEKGENLDGWTVDDITDFDVTLTDGAQFASLRLYGDGSESANTPPEPSAQFGAPDAAPQPAPDAPAQPAPDAPAQPAPDEAAQPAPDAPAQPAPDVAPDAK
jgi:hypothetical protein